MGDWDRKSRYQADLELQHSVLRIKNKRLKELISLYESFVHLSSERANDYDLWLSRQSKKELTEDEKRIEALEDLTLLYAGERDEE